MGAARRTRLQTVATKTEHPTSHTPPLEPPEIAGQTTLADDLVALVARVGILVVGLQTLAHLTNAFVLDHRVWNLSVDADGNVFSWLSSAVSFGAALAAAGVAYALPSVRRLALTLAAVFTFFSLDDVVAFHERLGQKVRGDVFGLETGWGRLIWPVLYFPLLAFSFVTLLRLAHSAPASARTAIKAALALLIGALIAEVAWAAFVLNDGDFRSWPNTLETAFEEGAELGAWFLIAAALGGIALAGLAERGILRSPRSR